jgi:hypothetical protein
MMKSRPFYLLVVAIFLSACATPVIATPAPTPEAIQVFYPPSLKYWADSLANCALNYPQQSLFFIPTYSTNELRENDIFLNFGQTIPSDRNAFLSQLGLDQVVLVVNTANQASQLSKHEIQQIFSGKVSNWDKGLGQTIQVWVLPDDDPTRTLFDNTILSNHELSSEARLAADADAMLEAIAQNSAAIGYLPESFLNSSDPIIAGNVKIILLETSLEAELHQPVIAITQEEPTGLLREILVCLQGTGN